MLSPEFTANMIKSGAKSEWIFSRLKYSWEQRFNSVIKSPKEFNDGYPCPISATAINFALYRICANCEYNFAEYPNCLCAAEAGIRKREDFKISEAVRKENIEKIRLKNEENIRRRVAAIKKRNEEQLAALKAKQAAAAAATATTIDIQQTYIIKPKLKMPKFPTNVELEYERKRIVSEFDPNSKSRFVDKYGRRWIKCKYCGEIKQENQMVIYGGDNGINMGVCSACSKKGCKL